MLPTHSANATELQKIINEDVVRSVSSAPGAHVRPLAILLAAGILIAAFTLAGLGPAARVSVDKYSGFEGPALQPPQIEQMAPVESFRVDDPIEGLVGIGREVAFELKFAAP